MKFLAVSALIVAAAAAPAYAPPPSTYPTPSAPDAPSHPGAPGAPAGSDYPKPGSAVPSVPSVPTITKPGNGKPAGHNGHDGKPGQPFINAPVDGTVVAPVSGNNIEVGKNILQNNNGGKGGKGGDSSPYPGGSHDDHDKPHGGDDKPHGGDDKPPAGYKPDGGNGSDGDKPEYAVPRSFINVPVKAGVLAPVAGNNVEVVKNVIQKNHRRGSVADIDVEHNNIANTVVNTGRVNPRYAPPAAAVPHGTAVNAPVDATVIAPVTGNNVEVVKNVAQNNEAWKGGYPHVPEPATEDPDYHLPKPAEPKAEYNEPRSFVEAPVKANVLAPVTGNKVEVVKNVLQENKVNRPRAEGKFINAPVDANVLAPVTGNKVEVVKNVLQENKINRPRAEGKFVNAPVDANVLVPVIGNNVEVAKNIAQKNGH